MKQLQQSSSVPSQINEQLVSRIEYARQQMLKSDLAGCVTHLRTAAQFPAQGFERRLDVLILLGLAHGMLRHYQQSYDIFTEAITIDPTMADLWYNRGLACRCTGRIGQAVLDLERAVELSKNDKKSEITRQFVEELKQDRQELQKAMLQHGADITFEQYLEREERFSEALNLVRQEKWQEAEPMFRQLAEEANRMPQYWGNLGISLMMQHRYDEAEAALKQAIAIDPDYAIARDNLRKLPKIRRSKRPMEIEVVEPPLGENLKQSLDIYGRDKEGTPPTHITIEQPKRTPRRSRHI